jgi:tetratricopeptide (TPR) repeat protein
LSPVRGQISLVQTTSAEPPSLRSSGRPTVRRAGAKDKQQKRTLAKDVNPASYRHSILHNICSEMLEKGFHKSFSELFNLVQQQRREHERAGPAAILLEPLIHSDHAKLEYLRVQLTAAEDAERTGNLEGVYVALKSLAQYFDRNQGMWLSFHFHQRSLEVAQRIKGDNQRAEGEGQCSVGLAMEKRGDLQRAAGNFEAYRRLAGKWKWCSESGDSVFEIACEHLRRVYTSMAKQIEAESPQEAIALLKKAHEMTRDSRNSSQEGLACYRLGQAHQVSGDLDTAIQYYRKYLEWSKYHKHHTGAGNAYEALAKCYEKKGDLGMAVKQLELYVEVADGAGPQSMARACSAIGTMYNTLGDYGKAVDFFGRCYELCSELDDPAALHEARAQYGIARGHQMFDSYATAVCTSLSGDLERLIMWKDERGSVEERTGNTVEDTGTGTGDEDGDNDEKEDEEEEEEEEEEKEKNVKDTEQDSEETT